MSSSAADFRESSGRKILEKKPSFSQTCSRLSRYLKENGSFGDLSLGMTCKPEINEGFAVSRQPTMMNLFPCEAASPMEVEDVKPKNMFPRQSSFSSSSSSGTKEEVEMIKETKSVVKLEETQVTGPLTIFYGGQVMMFEDFSAEKAKEVIDLATKRSVKSFGNEVNNNQTAYTQKEIVSTVKIAVQEPVKPNPSSLACELPIARRASLHRFLAKRKDRITSKAPYQIGGSTEASSKSPV